MTFGCTEGLLLVSAFSAIGVIGAEVIVARLLSVTQLLNLSDGAPERSAGDRGGWQRGLSLSGFTSMTCSAAHGSEHLT
ncbi:MAG: hypothetical protein HXY34_08875 [Candidatus Thorarchaeota archaeon]|nr:hypothetical protein [Candidatus Thorarchaeota archaeon]